MQQPWEFLFVGEAQASVQSGGGGRKAENLKFRYPETQLREQFFLNYTVHTLT